MRKRCGQSAEKVRIWCDAVLGATMHLIEYLIVTSLDSEVPTELGTDAIRADDLMLREQLICEGALTRSARTDHEHDGVECDVLHVLIIAHYRGMSTKKIRENLMVNQCEKADNASESYAKHDTTHRQI